MRILSHRGLWHTPGDKNSADALLRALDAGFGLETDVRQDRGNLVISHDPPTGGETALSAFLDMCDGRGLPVALNIKSDGLAEPIVAALEGRDLEVKVFDMSVPDMRSYFGHIDVLTRMSEVEAEPAWLDSSAGVWLDGFETVWFDEQLVTRLLDMGKCVWVVSPELHGRDRDELWTMLSPLADHPELALCTDFPEAARQAFGVAP